MYSFWHFDDFSWGNTRVVLDDGGDQVLGEEEIDIQVPLVRWEDYNLDPDLEEK